MSIQHMADIWADDYFGQGDKVKLLVALSIADNARSQDGLAWPSVDSIAKKARTSIRGVQEACRDLERDGKLEILVGQGPNGTNVYRVIPRNLCTPAGTIQSGGVQTVRGVNGAGCKPAAEKAPPVCTQTIRNSKEPPTSPTPGAAKPLGEEKGLPTSEEAKAIADLFHRRHTTPWSEKEIRAFKSGMKRKVITLEAIIGLIEPYYAKERAKGGEGIHRRDLLTFLNNFDGELDRAAAFKANPSAHDKHQPNNSRNIGHNAGLDYSNRPKKPVQAAS